jgi:glycerol-3-phosphate acyltransferase PlsX
MGGDFAPKNEVLGTILAAREREKSIELVLVGKEQQIKEILISSESALNNISIVNAEEVVTMDDSASDSFKSKPNSSISVALDLHKEKKVDAVISAGNTGAFTANSILKLNRIPGVGRPTIGTMLPTDYGKVMIFDVGAFVDCRANHLYEFAVMGSIYMSYLFNIEKPKVGLLNIGEEKSKGNEVSLEAYKLLENSNLNFIGNVEGKDILKGKAEIIVCDGFIGNIIIKFAESFLDVLKKKFKTYAEKSLFRKVWVGMIQNTLKNILKSMDYQEYGGVPLLGVNGVCIVGHGKSTPLAIKNMIFKAEEMVTKDVNKAILSYFA